MNTTFSHHGALRALAMVAIVVASVTTGAARLCAQHAAPVVTPRMFATSDDAIAALRDAAKLRDRAAVRDIFGPVLDEMMTGDKVEDSTDFEEFASAMTAMCNPSLDSAGTIVLNIGAQNWPFPIPLVKNGGKWFFNTAAGKEEIIARNIGEDELNTIRVCRAYVAAQREYAAEDRDGDGVPQFAMRFRSSQGKKDGLYWEPAPNEPLSPFGPLIADAQSEGYSKKPLSKSRRPFHGYFFKIITRQGPAAPGGAYDYVINGHLIAGFAMVAYPARWGESGIMTFIVNQQGHVYQCNLGPKTPEIAPQISEYNPDSAWTPVPEQTSAK